MWAEVAHDVHTHTHTHGVETHARTRTHKYFHEVIVWYRAAAIATATAESTISFVAFYLQSLFKISSNLSSLSAALCCFFVFFFYVLFLSSCSVVLNILLLTSWSRRRDKTLTYSAPSTVFGWVCACACVFALFSAGILTCEWRRFILLSQSVKIRREFLTHRMPHSRATSLSPRAREKRT